jgi:hypothetical protein
MKLCFISVNGPRETYFVDEPRSFNLLSMEREDEVVRTEFCYSVHGPLGALMGSNEID